MSPRRKFSGSKRNSPQVPSPNNSSPNNSSPNNSSPNNSDDDKTNRITSSSTATKFSNVNSPISLVPLGNIYQHDPLHLLVEDQHDAPYIVGDDISYPELTGSDFMPASKSWVAPNFAHRPLYFEEKQLERYGNRLPFQLLVSGAHFFSTIPVLPYMMGAQRPCERRYTYGNYRPGDCVPYDIYHRPFSLRGALNQALWTTAIVIP